MKIPAVFVVCFVIAFLSRGGVIPGARLDEPSEAGGAHSTESKAVRKTGSPKPQAEKPEEASIAR